MIRRPPRSTLDRSSAASDVYKRQDVRGKSDYNNVLSYNRSNAAVDYLVARYGIPKDRFIMKYSGCLLYTSPSPRDRTRYRMTSSA